MAEYHESKEKWFAVETPFEDDIKDYWGDWGLAPRLTGCTHTS